MGAGDTEKKYLEALRRVKAANVKVESERAKSAKLTAQIIDCDARLRATEVHPHNHASHTSSADHTTSPTHQKALIRELRTKLSETQKNNADLKRTHLAMKQDATRMRDLLKRELGDQHDLSALISDTSTAEGWRGRAQTITLLRQKVKDLQKCNPDNDVPSRGVGGGYSEAGTVSTARDYDDVNRSHLSEVASQRRCREQDQRRALETLQKQVSELTRKATGGQARIAVFEKETATLKLQLTRVIQKTENDDRLLSAYKKELETQREEYKRIGSAPAPSSPGPIQKSEGDLLVSVDRQKSEKIRHLDDAIYTAFNQSGARVLALLSEVHDTTKQPSSTLVYLSELTHLREYCDFLRAELTEERLRCESLEDALNRETHKTASSPPFDPNGLPPQVVTHMSILKGEVASLKERIEVERAEHSAEMSVWKRLVDEQKEISASFEQCHETAEKGHIDLKARYKELKEELARVLRGQEGQEGAEVEEEVEGLLQAEAEATCSTPSGSLE